MKKKTTKKKLYGHKRSAFEWSTMHSLCENGLMQGVKQEYVFIPGRRFRLDFAWPQKKMGLECHGVNWGSWGRHQSAPGVTNDCEKRNLGILLGWRVIEITQKHLQDGSAMRWVRELMGRKS